MFQLKGLRNKLKMETTFVERNNTNEEVFRRANEHIQNETREGKIPKKVIPFVKSYLNNRMKRLARLNNLEHDHPVRHITFGPNNENKTIPWNPPNRRVGRPRFKWVTETIKNIWENMRHLHTHIPQTFDNNNTEQHEASTCLGR